MHAYDPRAWESFFVAQAGASAALAGLLFVGVSINVSAIAASRRLSQRALEAFVLLAGVLVASALLLAPGISRVALGSGLAAIAAIEWLLVLWLNVRAWVSRSEEKPDGAPRGSLPIRIALAQGATLSLLVAATTLIAGTGGGIYWMVPAVIVSYVAALGNAWVLLVEILR